MPKYWGKQIFTHGRFPEVQRREKERKKDTLGARKHAWRTQAAWAKRKKSERW